MRAKVRTVYENACSTFYRCEHCGGSFTEAVMLAMPPIVGSTRCPLCAHLNPNCRVPWPGRFSGCPSRPGRI